MDSAHYRRSSETEDSLPMIDVDVVIIGAGISGLSAAYYIQKKDAGIRLAVLEAKGLRLLTSSPLFLCLLLSFHCPYAQSINCGEDVSVETDEFRHFSAIFML